MRKIGDLAVVEGIAEGRHGAVRGFRDALDHDPQKVCPGGLRGRLVLRPSGGPILAVSAPPARGTRRTHLGKAARSALVAGWQLDGGR